MGASLLMAMQKMVRIENIVTRSNGLSVWPLVPSKLITFQYRMPKLYMPKISVCVEIIEEENNNWVNNLIMCCQQCSTLDFLNNIHGSF